MTDHEIREHVERNENILLKSWAIVQKRKGILILFALPLFITVTIASFLIKPTYTATGTLLIEKVPNILTFEQILQMDSFNDDYYQTQYKLLKSRALAESTIEKLKLYENDKFVGKLQKANAGADKSDSSFRRQLTNAFLGRLDVNPIRQTRLVEVQFKDPDPKFAAETLNALFESFIDMNVQVKYEAAAEASEFLTRQIASLRTEIAKDEQELQRYGADKNIITLKDKDTTIVEKLGELNRALTEAQIDRVKKETYYNMIKGVSPESIPEALSNPLIQRLREDYGKLGREYLKMEERFGPEYPEMQRVKTELESAKKSLLSETQNLLNGAYSDWQAANQREKSLEEVFNKQKEQAFQLNNNAIVYNSLTGEVENKKRLMDSLLKRLSETDVSAQLKGLRSSNVRIVDRAEPPLSPSSPKKMLNMALALLVGLLGGTGLAFLFERLDDSVKNFDDVEKYTGLPPLGVVPAFSPNGLKGEAGAGSAKNVKGNTSGVAIKIKKNGGKNVYMNSRLAVGRRSAAAGSIEDDEGIPDSPSRPGHLAPKERLSIELIAFEAPTSSYSEFYRTIRSSLMLSSADPGPKCIAVASPLDREGKTSTVSNLAVVFAQASKSVLVVDSDLRKPRQHRIFKMLNVNGLSNYLSGTEALAELIKPTKIPNLFLINAGPVPPNPVELLGSEKMKSLIDKLRKSFDYVLFDTPPLLAVTDGLVLGAELDGLILVIWGEKTSREALKRAKEKLDMAKIKTLGVVINNLTMRKYDYYFKHQYHHYYNEEAQESNSVQAKK